MYFRKEKKQHQPTFNLIEPIDTSLLKTSFPFTIFANNHIIYAEDKEQFICDLINEQTMFEKCQTFITSHSFFTCHRFTWNREIKTQPRKDWKGGEEFFRPKILSREVLERNAMENSTSQKPCRLQFFFVHRNRHDNVNIF